MNKCVDESNINEYFGQKFGALTIIDYIPRTSKKERLKVKCLCDCGNECVRIFKEVRSGHTTTCGCRRTRYKDYHDDFIGQKFNRLTIIGYDGITNDHKMLAKCKCDCGNIHIATLKDVKNGHIKSCGCLQKEIARNRFLIDNRTNERLYTIYVNMKARCYNVDSPNYKHYGGRGIIICKEWLNDYTTFKTWSLNNGYNDNLSIDRINVNGNYEPSNCRWTTQLVQGNNKRNTIRLTYNNQTHTITEWADILHINRSLIASRYYKNLPIEKILYQGKLK